MKSEIFAVFDAKTECFMEPWFTQTEATAIRAFTHSVNDVTHPLGMDPADYTLFHLGHYNNDTGRIEMHDANINLGNGLEMIRPVKNEGILGTETNLEDALQNAASAGGTQ